MGPIVVAVFAAVVMLLLGVVVAAVRLLAVLKALRVAVDSTTQWLQPAIGELTEASQVTSLELAQLQTSIADLGAARSSDKQPGSGDRHSYTA